MPAGWSRNHKDIAQRAFTEALGAHLPAWLGDLPPIVEQLPTDLPRVATSDRQVDRLFRTADDWLLDLEIESGHDAALDRFLQYATELWLRYHQRQRTLVLHLGPPEPLTEHVDGGWLQFGVRREYVGARDAVATGARLRAQRAAPTPAWTGPDVLDVGFWPHMAGWDVPFADRVRQAAEMPAALPPKWAPAALAGVLGTAPAAVARAVIDSLREVRGVRSGLDVLVAEAEAEGEVRGGA